MSKLLSANYVCGLGCGRGFSSKQGCANHEHACCKHAQEREQDAAYEASRRSQNQIIGTSGGFLEHNHYHWYTELYHDLATQTGPRVWEQPEVLKRKRGIQPTFLQTCSMYSV